MSQYGSDANAKGQPMIPTTRLSDWTPARATALREWVESRLSLGSCSECSGQPKHGSITPDHSPRCAQQAATAALGRIETLERERDKWKDRYYQPFASWDVWQVSEPNEHGMIQYRIAGTTHDGIQVLLKPIWLRDELVKGATARAEAAERVQEGLRAERDALRWRLHLHDTYQLLTRADAEAIAVKVFETWRQSPPFLEIPPFGERERFSHPTGQAFLDALSRAFQGSAEPPGPMEERDAEKSKVSDAAAEKPQQNDGARAKSATPPPSVQSDPIPARQPTPRIESIHESVTMSMNHAGHLFAGDTCVNCGCSCASFNAAQMCGGKRPSFTSDSAVSASERPTRETLDALSDQPALDAALHTTDTLSATDDSHRHPPAISDLPGAPTTKRFCPGAHSFDKGVCTWCGFSYPKSESHAACHDVVCNADMGSARGGDGCSCVGRQKRIEAENTRRSALIEQLTTALVEAKTAERDTLARARAAVEAVLHADADPFEQPGLNAALRALDALAAQEPG